MGVAFGQGHVVGDQHLKAMYAFFNGVSEMRFNGLFLFGGGSGESGPEDQGRGVVGPRGGAAGNYSFVVL